MASPIAEQIAKKWRETDLNHRLADIVDEELRAAGLLKEPEPQISPGPWKFDDYVRPQITILSGSSHKKPEYVDVEGPNRKANAKAIALTPEMLALCEAAHDYYNKLCESDTAYSRLRNALNTWNKRRAEIGK